MKHFLAYLVLQAVFIYTFFVDSNTGSDKETGQLRFRRSQDTYTAPRCRKLAAKLAIAENGTDVRKAQRLTKKLAECKGVVETKCDKWARLFASGNLNKARSGRLLRKQAEQCGPRMCAQLVQQSSVGLPDVDNDTDFDSTNDGYQPTPDYVIPIQLFAPDTIVASTCNAADFDTVIKLYDQNLSTKIVYNDDGDGCGSTSLLSTNVGAGRYILIVTGYPDEAGTFDVNVTCTHCACSTS